MHTLTLTTINLHTKFEMCRYAHSKDMMTQNLELRHVTTTTPNLGVVCHPRPNISSGLPLYKI